MKEINYWERFLMTGSISDFLSYKNALKDMEDEQEKDKRKGALKVRSGEGAYAGLHGTYRDGFKG